MGGRIEPFDYGSLPQPPSILLANNKIKISINE